MRRLTFLLVLLAAFVALPMWTYAQQGGGQAAAPPPGSGHAQHGGMGHGDHDAKGQDHNEKMMGSCKAFKEKHDQFAADMKAMDARLDEKIAAMNAAKGDQKMAAMAAVITEMAAQRKEMFEKFGAMHRDRMGCMKAQGKDGMMMGGHEGMMGGKSGGGMAGGCPMMQQHHGSQQGESAPGQGDTGKEAAGSKT